MCSRNRSALLTAQLWHKDLGAAGILACAGEGWILLAKFLLPGNDKPCFSLHFRKNHTANRNKVLINFHPSCRDEVTRLPTRVRDPHTRTTSQKACRPKQSPSSLHAPRAPRRKRSGAAASAPHWCNLPDSCCCTCRPTRARRLMQRCQHRPHRRTAPSRPICSLHNSTQYTQTRMGM